MIKAFIRRLLPAAPVPKYTVVGTVFVHAGGGDKPNQLVRLDAGTQVKVVERRRYRGKERVIIEDPAGRTGVCAASEVWEHVAAC